VGFPSRDLRELLSWNLPRAMCHGLANALLGKRAGIPAIEGSIPSDRVRDRLACTGDGNGEPDEWKGPNITTRHLSLGRAVELVDDRLAE
jgi:hypothetical protein